MIPQEVRDMEPGDRLLKPIEVARKFKVSVSAVYRWAAEGKLDFVKIAGHTIRILESSVKNIIADI
jgi:excisionase family DNA binding protein